MRGLIRLASGRWYSRVERDARGFEFLYLSSADHPGDMMRIRLPFSWRGMHEDELSDLAREPELRLWTDEFGIQWRVAAVGPGTPYSFPLRSRYLVFDSSSTWAGVARFPDGDLGELTDAELRVLRDATADIGGGRRAFRPPVEHVPGDGPTQRT